MANKSRFIVAESRIRTFFKENGNKVYTKEVLTTILEENRQLWNLPFSMYVNKFIEKLVSSEILIHETFVLHTQLIKKERYIAADATVFQIALSLANKSYLSHFSAVYIHGLTNQIPKTVYVSFEQTRKNGVDRELTQTAIDSAFLKPQRKSGVTNIYKEYTLLIHNGMHSNRAGVYSLDGLPVTNLERTLIDIAVRPNYAGGVDSILDIYRRAIDKISIHKLVATLEKLNFIYPYNQAIGFYLEKAGYDINKLTLLCQHEFQFDFYLTYQIVEKEYDKKWKIYYPKGM